MGNLDMWKMGENLKMSTSEFTTFRGSLAEKIPRWEGKRASKVRICPTLYKLIAEGKSFFRSDYNKHNWVKGVLSTFWQTTIIFLVHALLTATISSFPKARAKY